jgi:hypothetical protein
MKRLSLAFAIALAVPGLALAQDADRKITGGGIAVDGWKGKIDAGAVKKGLTINDSKFAKSGDDLHLTIGPAAFYWNDANKASGSYTVSATFKEGKPDAGHPHPYGIFIGGKDLETDAPNLVYCLAYSNGTYLVRGFSGGKVVNFAPAPGAGGRVRPAAHEAVNKTGADGVTQTIAWTVKDGTASCSINGQVVASFDKAALIGEGKLASTDGIYGLRASHNLDVIVSGFGKK